MNKIIQIFQLEKSHVKYLFAVAILILLSANIVTFMNARDIDDLKNYTALTEYNVKKLEEVRDKITAAQTGRSFFYISDDKSYIIPYTNTASAIDTIYSKLRLSTADNPTVQDYLDTLSYYVKMRFDLMNRGIDLQSRKGNTFSTVRSEMEEGKELTYKIMNIITRAQDEEYRSLINKIDVTNSKSSFTKYILIVSSVFSIFILVFSFAAATKIYSTGGSSNVRGRLTQNELETIVRDRTAEISQINSRLYKAIQKHEKYETELKKKEREYRILFEQAHDAIMIFDPDTSNVLDVNERACKMYQIPRNEFLGLPLKAIVKNVPETVARIKKTIENKFLNNFQTVHYKKDGSEMLVEINGSVIPFKGKPAILSINKDVTDKILRLTPLHGFRK